MTPVDLSNVFFYNLVFSTDSGWPMVRIDNRWFLVDEVRIKLFGWVR